MRRPITHVVTLSIVVFGLWLVLSGHWDPFLLFLGLLSTALVVTIALRMEVIDHEGVPVIHMTRRIWTYLPWLMGQIVRSNLAVARIILDPKLPISPTLVRFVGLQRTDLGRVILANSITLTPGTVTVAVTGERLYVHGLYSEAVEDLEDGEMNRRAAQLERGLRVE